jgi:hypothetical protein
MRLLGGKVLAARSPQEISAEARVLQWLEKSGRNGDFSKENLVRGTLLNFRDATVKIPGTGRVTQDLTTNCILVDIQGGEPLPTPRDKSPGMILVMDETGNLVVHDEVAEAKEWDEATREPEGGGEHHTRREGGGRARPGDHGGIDRSEIDTDRDRPQRRLPSSGH